MTFIETMKQIYKEKVFSLSRENYRLRLILARAMANQGVLTNEDVEYLTLKKSDGNLPSTIEEKDDVGHKL